MKEFEIRRYGKTELALLYNPHLTPGGARKQLMASIKAYPNLLTSLKTTGYTTRSRLFTPRQVEIIITALGKPSIRSQ